MRVFDSVAEFASWTRAQAGLGFVPTMGALHQGHLQLVARSRAENPLTAVSIFVNPTQFDDPNDLRAYPRPLEEDLALLGEARVDAVLAPKGEAGAAQMYPDGYTYKVVESKLSAILEGAHRKGHFEGMLTVVLKLLMAANARNSYFGEKDWQQLQLVRGMVQAFFLPTVIVGCPIVREPHGLAMSSRNTRLSPEGRTKAAAIYQALQTCSSASEVHTRLSEAGFSVDYAADEGSRRLVAARLEGVRLLDNIAIDPIGRPLPDPHTTVSTGQGNGSRSASGSGSPSTSDHERTQA